MVIKRIEEDIDVGAVSDSIINKGNPIAIVVDGIATMMINMKNQDEPVIRELLLGFDFPLEIRNCRIVFDLDMEESSCQILHNHLH